MTRWLPYPLLTLALLIMWLLLSQSIAPAQLLLGSAIAIYASRAMARLQPEKAKIVSYRPIPGLAGRVFLDLVRSNIAVARIVLWRGQRKRTSGFIQVPLDMRNRYGLTILACIITATPGTIWVQFDRRTNRLLVHVLDLIDEDQWVRLIKGRYEQRLMEIFE